MGSRSNRVRIIGGQWRGRKLSFPDVEGLRPTPDRIRETLFNWLAPLIPEACCLDLFAGSGALGFEAASRGAARVVMVEQDPGIVRALRLNRKLLCADMIEIFQQKAAAYLADPGLRFGVVFLDPPFRQGHLSGCMQRLEENGWLAADAFIYIESEKGLQPELPGGWVLHRDKQAGQVAYRLVRRAGA